MREQIKFNSVIMRGGTSKAVFLREDELPHAPQERERLILAVFGSPDPRQIDGLGGADYLTSKCAIIGKPTRADADIDYTFAQVSILNPHVSFDANCGNISAAVALYAVEEGYVPLCSPGTTVRIHNVNTGRLLKATVPVCDGEPLVEGDFGVDGVPSTGAQIEIDFADSAGGCTGALLPTGLVRDTIAVSGLERQIGVSIVDVGNPYVFIRAEDLGVAGTELPGEFDNAVLGRLEEIRKKASVLCRIESHILPAQIIVSKAAAYRTYVPGKSVASSEVDVVGRLFLEGMAHKAFAGTGAVCIGVAAGIPGTVVHELTRKHIGNEVRIGHPSGVLPIVVEVAGSDSSWEVRKAVFSRTARRLMDGKAYVRRALVEAPADAVPPSGALVRE